MRGTVLTFVQPFQWSPSDARSWLQAPPVSSLCLRMDDNTVRVAIGLCLVHCGAEVDCLTTHGLHCRWSAGMSCVATGDPGISRDTRDPPIQTPSQTQCPEY